MSGDVEAAAQRLYGKVWVLLTSPEGTGYHAATTPCNSIILSVFSGTGNCVIQPSQHPAFQRSMFTWV